MPRSDDEDAIFARQVARYLGASEGGRRLDDAIARGKRYLDLVAQYQESIRKGGVHRQRAAQAIAEALRRERGK